MMSNQPTREYSVFINYANLREMLTSFFKALFKKPKEENLSWDLYISTH